MCYQALFVSSGDQTQGLMHARPSLYQLNYKKPVLALTSPPSEATLTITLPVSTSQERADSRELAYLCLWRYEQPLAMQLESPLLCCDPSFEASSVGVAVLARF